MVDHGIRWSDDRLDDLSRRVERIEPLVSQVAILGERVESNTRATERNTKATEHVAGQLEESKLEPFTRARNFRNAVFIVLISAAVGTGFALISAAITGH